MDTLQLSIRTSCAKGWLVAFALCLCACADASGLGHLSIVVDAQAAVRAEARELIVKTPSIEHSFDVSKPDAWPTAFTFYGKPGTQGVVELWAKGTSGTFIKRTLALTFPTGRKALNVLLHDTCIARGACENSGDTCGDCGVCVSKAVAPSRLMSVESEPEAHEAYRDPPCTPGEGSVDAGDVTSMDASMDGSMPKPARDGSMDAGLDGKINGSAEAAVPDASTAFSISGPRVVAVGTCAPIDLQRTVGLGGAANVDLEVSGGRLYSSDTCDDEIAKASFAAGNGTTRIYFRKDELGDGGLSGSAHVDATLAELSPAGHDLEVRARAVGISRGSYFGCALLSDGQVQCVGEGSFGATGKCCGALDPVPARVPVTVSGPATMLADDNTTCFVQAGKLGCFGPVDFTASGPADASGLITSPEIASGVTRADLGINTGCAVKDDHSLYCWGSSGKQCDASGAPVKEATRLTRLDDEGLTAGNNWVEECITNYVNMCARLADGKVYCWGGDADTELIVPGNATRLAENFGYACAVIDDGASDDDVVCWTSAPFKTIDGLPEGKVEHLAVAANAGCVAIDEKLYCWGLNVAGGLGTGNSDDKTLVSAERVTNLPEGDIEAVALGYAQAPTMFALVDGLVYGWGLALYGELGIDERHAFVRSPTRVPQLDGLGIEKISIGRQTSCALLAGGLVRCWGQQLGTGLSQGLADGDFSLTPTAPSDFASRGGFIQLVPSDYFSFALRDDGGSRELYAWGNNNFLQLGTDLLLSDGSPTSRPSADIPKRSLIAEAGGGKIVKVSSGTYNANDGATACKLVDDGSISCWGSWASAPDSIYEPQLAVQASDSPRDLSASCALFDHTVECWTDSTWARTTILTFPSGIETIDAEVSTVCGKKGTDVHCSFKGGTTKLTFSNVAEYAVGGDFACAILTDGTVECVGSNDYGQLGRQPLGGTLPKGKVPGLTSAAKLAAGDAMACVEDGGRWKCWGGNRNGNMGVVPYVYAQPTLIAPWGQ